MSVCSPFGAAGEFAASRHGVLTRRQAADVGLTPIAIRRLIRDGVLHEPVPGVLVVVGSPPTWRQRLQVATLASNAAGVDFAIPHLKIAMDAHSRRFHLGRDAEDSDAAREAALHAEGWIVRFVTDRQRRGPAELRRSISTLITARSPA